MKLNRLLNKQVLKYLPADFLESEQGSQFIQAVNSSYNAYERDIDLLNHAFRINEEEYTEINGKLKEQINVRQISIGRLKNSIDSISVKTESFNHGNESDELLDIVNFLDEQIDKRVQAEHMLRIREEKYRNIAANMRLGLLEVDNNDHISFVNQSFCDMSGYEYDDLIGKRASHIYIKGENIERIENKN